jgi:hydrogenase nickel incorporation protein HypA/HybF
MHELSIAQSIVETVLHEAAAHGGGRVTRVAVRVGEISGINPDALSFAFDVIVRDTDLAAARLEIEQVPLTQRCRDCGHRFRAVEFQVTCPACGALGTDTVAGDELQVAFLEME